MTSSRIEKITKHVVIVSAGAAIAAGTWLGARAWAPLLWLVIAAFAAAFAIGKWSGTRVWAPIMVFAYTFPAVMLILHGFSVPAYWNIWLAAIYGGVLSTGDIRGWSLPQRWKWPLMYWALAIALVWPVIIAREADFKWALLSEYHIANSILLGSPPVVSVWVLHVALTHLIGILWTDAAFAAFPLADRRHSLLRFTRDMAWPLVASIVIGSLVAIYQGTIDITFLSEHQYVALQRATSSLDDGNAFGVAAGLLIGGLIALAATASKQWLRTAAVAGIALTCGGLWATGSRMAFTAALFSFACAAWTAFAGGKVQWRKVLIIALPAAALIGVLGMLSYRSGTMNPVQRIMMSLPGLSKAEISDKVEFELWNRYGPFGTVSMNMARDYPLSGIGVGTFNDIFPDESFVLIGSPAHKDNAQSWYRHQLAELGILGSLGWILWVPMVGVMLWRTRGDDDGIAGAGIKGALIGIAVISLVSMPTQALPVAFLVWVLIYWYLLLSSSAAELVAEPVSLAQHAYAPAVVWTAALVFTGATLFVGWRDLRPPLRALHADWTYTLQMLEPDPPLQDMSVPHARWTSKHSAEVLPVRGKWLKLVIGGGPPDIASKPIHLEVKRRGKTIISVTFSDGADQVWYVKPVQGAKRMMLEFDVDRTWRPSDYGIDLYERADPNRDDAREHGLRVREWTFVDELPRGAVVIE